MIRLMSIGSGSSGNCTYIEINGKKILIDLGLNAKRISAALSGIGIGFQDIDAVFITHTHNDHVSALPVCRKRLECPVYMTEISYITLHTDGVGILTAGESYELLGGIKVTVFDTSHDCPGSVGFRFDAGGSSLGYATDLGYVSDEILNVLTGAETVVLEANHDVTLLKKGPYPYYLKKRILSNNGHLSNDICAETARYLAHNGTKTIFLAHLSRENNTPSIAHDTVKKALEGTDTKLVILPQYDGSLRSIE